MPKLLVPVDGSEIALAAVRFAADLARDRPGTSIHLLNVQTPITGSAARFLGKKPVHDYYEAEGKTALEEACRLLDAAGVAYERHVAIGAVAEAIVGYAKDRGCDQIVMTTRGLGALPGLLLGSVATRVLHLATMPVTFVR